MIKVKKIVDEILDSKNWTGQSLRDLVAFGRVVPANAKQWAFDYLNESNESETDESALTVKYFFTIAERVEDEAEKIRNENN